MATRRRCLWRHGGHAVAVLSVTRRPRARLAPGHASAGPSATLRQRRRQLHAVGSRGMLNLGGLAVMALVASLRCTASASIVHRSSLVVDADGLSYFGGMYRTTNCYMSGGCAMVDQKRSFSFASSGPARCIWIEVYARKLSYVNVVSPMSCCDICCETNICDMENSLGMASTGFEQYAIREWMAWIYLPHMRPHLGRCGLRGPFDGAVSGGFRTGQRLYCIGTVARGA